MRSQCRSSRAFRTELEPGESSQICECCQSCGHRDHQKRRQLKEVRGKVKMRVAAEIGSLKEGMFYGRVKTFLG